MSWRYTVQIFLLHRVAVDPRPRVLTRNRDHNERPGRHSSSHGTGGARTRREKSHWWTGSVIFSQHAARGRIDGNRFLQRTAKYALSVPLDKPCMSASSFLANGAFPCRTWRAWIHFVGSWAASKTLIWSYEYYLPTQGWTRMIFFQEKLDVRGLPVQERCWWPSLRAVRTNSGWQNGGRRWTFGWKVMPSWWFSMVCYRERQRYLSRVQSMYLLVGDTNHTLQTMTCASSEGLLQASSSLCMERIRESCTYGSVQSIC